jgi:hypothetical protein
VALVVRWSTVLPVAQVQRAPVCHIIPGRVRALVPVIRVGGGIQGSIPGSASVHEQNS